MYDESEVFGMPINRAGDGGLRAGAVLGTMVVGIDQESVNRAGWKRGRPRVPARLRPGQPQSSASGRLRANTMSVTGDIFDWKLQNDKFRSPKSRNPDVYYMGPAKEGKYVILADGWEARGKRRQLWIPADKATKSELNKFGREEAEKLALSRGVSSAGGDGGGDKKVTSSIQRKKKGEVFLGVALAEIEADKSAGVCKNTAANTTAGCRTIRDRLAPERLTVPVRRITPSELERQVRQSIIDDPKLSRETKLQYLAQARAVVRILFEYYDMDEDCEAALRAPPNMSGADTEERPFIDGDITVMENAVGGELFQQVLKLWAEAVEGAYYFGSRLMFQSVDVMFRKHDEFTPDLKFIIGRRFKTGEFFFMAVPECIRTWMLKRRARGGIWAEGYIFQEFVHGIRKCLSATGPLVIFPHNQEKDLETNVTGRFRDYFDKFLDEICEIKRPGISFVSFRHYNLPVLRSGGASVEVGMDMAGQSTIEAYFGYGGHGSAQQHLSACALMERHYRNRKAGKNETVIATHWDTAQYVVKALRRVMKKLLQAIDSSTMEVVRKISHIAAALARGFSTTHAKLDALNDNLSNLQGAMRELRDPIEEPIVATGAQLITFASINDLDCRNCAEMPEAQNHNNKGSTAIELVTNSI